MFVYIYTYIYIIAVYIYVYTHLCLDFLGGNIYTRSATKKERLRRNIHTDTSMVRCHTSTTPHYSYICPGANIYTLSWIKKSACYI